MNLVLDSHMKMMVEKYPCALATVMPDDNPNVIGIGFLKVVSNNEILITDDYMNQTIIDIQNNPNSVLIVWDENMNGYKMIGTAKYFNKGNWVKMVKNMPENKEYPAKGAILFQVKKVLKTA